MIKKLINHIIDRVLSNDEFINKLSDKINRRVDKTADIPQEDLIDLHYLNEIVNKKKED